MTQIQKEIERLTEVVERFKLLAQLAPEYQWNYDTAKASLKMAIKTKKNLESKKD